MEKKQIIRREFYRTSTIPGLSVGVAYSVVRNTAGSLTGLIPVAHAQTPQKGRNPL